MTADILALLMVLDDKFARIHASLRKLLRERGDPIITGAECVLRIGVNTLPEIFFALVHLNSVGASTSLTRNRRVREKDFRYDRSFD